MESGKDGLESDRPAQALLPLCFDLQRGEDSKQRRYQAKSIDGGGAAKSGINNSSQRRAENCRELKDTGGPGNGARKMFFGNQLREQSAAHRTIQRANDAEEYDYGIDRIDRMTPVQRDEQQQRRAQSESGITQNDEFAPLEAVRNIP